MRQHTPVKNSSIVGFEQAPSTQPENYLLYLQPDSSRAVSEKCVAGSGQQIYTYSHTFSLTNALP
eukprot:SAG11_NODE_17171_length_526_cov_0.915691_1_plen_64_part_10